MFEVCSILILNLFDDNYNSIFASKICVFNTVSSRIYFIVTYTYHTEYNEIKNSVRLNFHRHLSIEYCFLMLYLYSSPSTVCSLVLPRTYMKGDIYHPHVGMYSFPWQQGPLETDDQPIIMIWDAVKVYRKNDMLKNLNMTVPKGKMYIFSIKCAD